MSHLLIRHKVADFARWKLVYDAHLPARERAGLTEKHLLRSVENQHEIIILYETADLKKAHAFVASSDLLEAMQKAGVTDKPDLWFLT
jgi:hypothetical protein